MASDVDIILEVAVNGVNKVNDLSNAVKQLNKFTENAVNPIKALDARSRALNLSVGASGRALNNHAKTVKQLATNQTILSSEISKVSKELKGLGSSYNFATGASRKFQAAGVQGLKAYHSELKKIKFRSLIADIKSVGQESKRLGKDMQFVGRSLIIGLTTPITMGTRQALQGLVALDTEIVRLTKVLEGVAPTADIARQKLGAMADDTQVKAMVDSFTELKGTLTDISQKFGLARSLTVGLAADFAELGITQTDNIAKLTELTAVAEKLGNMDISNAQDLIQSLYFQSVRTLSIAQPRLTAIERERKAIASATAQLQLFNQVENVTALTLKDLGDAFPEVAAAATSFGLSMTEAGALLAPMKAAGFEVGASANSIKVSLQRITAPTKQNADLLNRLSREYGTHFKEIKGSGLDALQSLSDAYNDVTNSAAGAEGAQEMFAKLFGVRQGPRMEVAVQQLALFDSILKDTSQGSAKLAEKQIQNIANSVISASDATLPLINNFRDIGILSRIATATIDPRTLKATVEGFGEVTQSQIDAAKKARIEIGKEMARVTQEATLKAVKEGKKAPGDLIAQIGTETGRALMIQLAGPYTAAQLANNELERALDSLAVQLSMIRNNFKNFTGELVEGLRPAITKIVEISDRLYNAWKNLAPETKQLISNITLIGLGMVASIGPLVFVIGQARLAFGTLTKALFSFLPSLKTMSIEALAGRSAMLKLKNPLTVVGETVVNTNSKFATWIATLASGEGKIAKFATRVGEMSGVLKKTTTAPLPLVSALNEERFTKKLGASAPGLEVFGPTGARSRRRSLDEVEEAMRKRAVRALGFGTLAPGAGDAAALTRGLSAKFVPGTATSAIAGAGLTLPTGPLTPTAIYDDIKKQILASMGFPVAGGRGPGGRFSRPIADMLSEAETMQAAGTTSASAGVRGPGGRFRRLTSAERAALKAIEDAENLVRSIFDAADAMATNVVDDANRKAAAAMAKSKELTTKGIDFDPLTGKTKFKGREISDKRSADIYRGGVRGMFARTAEFGGRARESVAAKIPKPDLNPINAYKRSVAGASAAMATLNAQTMAATGMAPRKFATASAAAKGFATSTSLGTKALKFLKIALISSGIGVVLLAVGAAAIIVKNNMETFSKVGKKGFETIGRVVKILKSIVEELARPFVDLFASFSGGKQGAEGAADGIGKAFNGIAVAIEFVAKMVKWLVTNIIQPYFYGIANLVKFIVNLFQGKWSDALKSLGAAFANVFGGIVKLGITIFAFLVKQIINVFTELPSAFTNLIASGIEKATDLFFSFIEWVLKQIKKIPGVGKFLGGVGDNVLGGLTKARDVYIGVLRGVAKAQNDAGDWVKKGIDKMANGAKKSIDSLAKGGIKRSKGSLKLFDREKTKGEAEDLGDDVQEIMANSIGNGFDEGVEDGVAKAKKHLRELKKELQEEIVSRAKSALEGVVDALTNSLQAQKENALKIYDDQIENINNVAKAEERLTEAKEYEINRRELLDKRELDATNFRRQRMLAIYEGRIDDARQLSLEQAAMEQESDKEVKQLDQERNKQIADQKREDLIDSINKAKDVAAKYFEDMIKGFQDAAKKITEFPPTTAEQFNDQLEDLKDIAITAAKSMGTKFTEGITNVLPNLATKAESPLTTALAAIGKTIGDNNPFGTEGVWQKSIDGAIEYLTKKYEGLNGTMTLVFDESSAKFKTLFDTYQKYKKLMEDYETATSGAGSGKDSVVDPKGSGLTNTRGGTGRTDTSGRSGFGATTPSTLRDLATKAFKEFNPNYRGGSALDGIEYIFQIFKDYKTNRSKGEGAALGNFMKKYPDYNQGIKKIAHQTAARAFLSSGYTFAKGGKMPFMGDGPTNGPTQQGIPAILHGGEYVVRNSAVKKYGWGMLDSINQGSYNPKSYFKGGILDESRGRVGLKNVKTPSKKTNAQDKIRDAIKNPAKHAGSAKSTFVSYDDPDRQEKLDKIQSDFNKSGFGKAWRTAGFAFDLLSPAALLPIGYAIGAGKDINTGKKLSAKQRFLVEPGKLALGAAAVIAGLAVGKVAMKGVSKVIPKVASVFGKKTIVNTVADATSVAAKVADDVAKVKEISKELDIVRNPSRIDDYIAESITLPTSTDRIPRIARIPGKPDFKYASGGDEVDIVTDLFKIGTEKIAFGLDDSYKFLAGRKGIKSVSKNPFEIANVDPLSQAGKQVALTFAYAKNGLYQSLAKVSGKGIEFDELPNTVEALLYAASRGDRGAAARLASLRQKGATAVSAARQKATLTNATALNQIASSKYKNLDLEDLFVVHETAYKPSKDALGNLIIKPTGDFQTKFETFTTLRDNVSDMISKGLLDPNNKELLNNYIINMMKPDVGNFSRKFPSTTGDMLDTVFYKLSEYYRDTIHFALNHIVSGHAQRPELGSGGHVIVAKLTEILKNNPGALESLYAVDTWFTPPPGQGLIIPKGSFEIIPSGDKASRQVSEIIKSRIDPSKWEGKGLPIFSGGDHGLSGAEQAADFRIRQIADQLGVSSGTHFETPSWNIAMKKMIDDYLLFSVNNLTVMADNTIWRALTRFNPTGMRGILTKTDPNRFVMSNGGLVPKFASQSVPGLLHGGEFVINSSAVKNIGLLALEAMNNLRFQKPKVGQNYQPSGYSQPQSTSTVHIYVDNFIGEKAWFESMMKDYNISIAPQNQKNAGLQNRTITTYNGINRGL